jgi:hypothetical protein
MGSQKSIQLPHSAITKATGLLPMMYSITELCIELDIPRHTVRAWLQAGLPHQRDSRQHIWINGKTCNQWITEIRQAQKKKKHLTGDQAYCLRCQKVIRVKNPQIFSKNGNRRLSGSCPKCDGTVNKGLSNGQSEELQTNTRVSTIQKRSQPTQ